MVGAKSAGSRVIFQNCPTPALPPADLLWEQAEWLAPARARLLRRVAIAHRRRVLDLGAGYGAVTAELVRRAGGPVVALDREVHSLCEAESFAGAGRVAGDAHRLPLAGATFDLVFCQCALLWMIPLEMAVAEIWRVLRPGGALVALEPDYGGLIEHPPEIATADLWLAALARAGAEPQAGRRLPGLLAAQGFAVRVGLLDELQPAAAQRFDFLRGLPLTEAEQARLAELETLAAGRPGWQQVAHLPFFLITAEKPGGV